LLTAPLGPSPPSDATPFAARALASGQSHLDALKARCAPSSSCLAQAGAGETGEIRPVQTGPSQTPTSSSISADSVCNALAAAAADKDLPVGFFTPPIWPGSRLDPP